MVGAARHEPRLGGRGEVGSRTPERTRDRKLRQRLVRLDELDLVHHQAEAIAEVFRHSLRVARTLPCAATLGTIERILGKVSQSLITAVCDNRYSEKLLQAFGISVSTIDLSDVFGRAAKLTDDDPRVKERLERVLRPKIILQSEQQPTPARLTAQAPAPPDVPFS